MESINIYQDGQDVSPDSVFYLEAASRAPPSVKEAKLLEKLREKLEKEAQQVWNPNSIAKGCIRPAKPLLYFADLTPGCLMHRHLCVKWESNGFICSPLPACVTDWPCNEDVLVYVYIVARAYPTLVWGAAIGGVIIPQQESFVKAFCLACRLCKNRRGQQ